MYSDIIVTNDIIKLYMTVWFKVSGQMVGTNWNLTIDEKDIKLESNVKKETFD